jgi:hypothetical protein
MLPKQMPRNTSRLLALLVGLVLLTGQVHFYFCVDWMADSYSSHSCPLCGVAGSAILMRPPSIAVMPIVSEFDRPAIVFGIFYAVLRLTPTRAPPSA